MQPPSFSTLRPLFEACIELSPMQRAAWIDQHVTDQNLRAELLAMLAADGQADGFLQQDVADHIERLRNAEHVEFEAEQLVGRQFGAFELLWLLGKGGQGVVYLAKRINVDFDQLVALKLLRRGLHDPIEHRRFRREREILGRLEHPGVARLIDGGVSAEGIPFLAMEFVQGSSIVDWSKDRQLDSNARLMLFADLCKVVAAAHRNLIVHRDLKPSNVLVDQTGAIKVLDFGIARLLDEDESQTERLHRMHSQGFSAPEQVSGGAITLSTDVFALGVLLYVMLTEKMPSDPRLFQNAQYPKTIAKDLRWVIQKASAVDPDLRYRDADELLDDIHRFLEFKPVRAHPPSRWYQFGKFTKRNWVSLSIAAFVFVVVLVSLAVTTWQADLAHTQLMRAQASRDFLLGLFEAAKESLPRDSRPTPKDLVKIAAQKLQSDASLGPELRAELHGTLSAISYSSNDYAEAIAQSQAAANTLTKNNLRYKREYLIHEIGIAKAQTQLGMAAAADKSLQLSLTSIRQKQDDIAAEGLLALAAAKIQIGQLQSAKALSLEAVDLMKRIHGEHSQAALKFELAHGDLLALAGDNLESATRLTTALSNWRLANLPQNYTYANSLQNLAAAQYHLGRADDAERLLRESLVLARTIHTSPHEKIADALSSLAVPLLDAGRFDEAQTLLQEAAAMYRKLFGPSHPQNASMLDALGSLENKRRRYADAVGYLVQATEICKAPEFAKNSDCGRYWQNLSFAYLKLGQYNEAAAANAKGLSLRRALYGENHPSVAGSLAGHASVLLAQLQPQSALVAIDQALSIFTSTGQGESLGAATMHRVRATALKDLHRYDEALQVLNDAETLVQKLAPNNVEQRASALALRAELMADTQQWPLARKHAKALLILDPELLWISPSRHSRLIALAK